MVRICLVLQETSKMFFEGAVPVFIPTKKNKSCCFSTSSSTLGVVSVVAFGHSIVMWWYLIVLVINSTLIWCWTSFHMLTLYLHIFFGKVSVQIFCPFLIHVVHFLVVKGLYQMHHLQIFSQVYCLSFHSQVIIFQIPSLFPFIIWGFPITYILGHLKSPQS